MSFTKWPKIPRFSNVAPADRQPRSYTAKVKLDGTNAGIGRTEEGDLFYQSRSRVITPEDDNYGFATWAHSLPPRALDFVQPGQVWFGEWAGPGVQKRTAVSKIPQRTWFPFAFVQRGKVFSNVRYACAGDLPETIRPVLGAFHMRIEWTEAHASLISDAVLACEEEDPLIAEVFGISGLGEGYVFFPAECHDQGLDIDLFKLYAFKAKGEKHQVVKTKTPAQVDPEKAANAEAFADLVVTPARLEQGLEAVGGVKDRTKTGQFLKWIAEDVRSEHGPELEASGLVWKDVAKHVASAARSWWFA